LSNGSAVITGVLDFLRFRLTFAAVVSPFRDETESLRAENERLRAELARRAEPRPLLAFGLIAGDLVAIVVLRPWLNGSSDMTFWAAFAFIVLLAVAATVSALGYKRRR
jgi:hypothetical protein